ncbi:MAG TPA: N-acetylmuramoyl-L-alanine amidase, partial [Polyangiaceae bacterium]
VASQVSKEPTIDEKHLSTLEARARAWLATAAELPARAEVVALADELAVAAARSGPGLRAVQLSRLAAELRTRLWRVGHVEADAREAIELHAAASKAALAQGFPDEGCQSSLGQAWLAAELARDPVVLYRELYSSAKLYDRSACEGAFDGALKTMAAYRPSHEVLARLDEEVEKKRMPAAPTAAAPAASARVVSADETGVVLAPMLAPGAAVKVLALEPYGSKDRARIVVTLSGATSYRVGELAGPRLFLDLEQTEASHQREIAVGGLVDKVRQAPHGRGGTRIVLDLATQAYRRVFYLPEPFRVVIDVATQPPERVSLPPGSPRAVTRVALDAGHGGSDPGAIGPAGLREKDVTLDIAHLTAPILSRELGILTLLTRDDDRLVPLDERAARANAFHAELLVSIHCNASESGAARGVMSFVLDTARDDVAAKIAARENATSIAAGSQAASIASGLRLPDVRSRSTHLAELLQRSVMASLAGRFGDTSDQGVRTGGFFVLVGAEMPSVLFEAAFISNPAEEKRLGTADYKQKLADGIANAIRAYREGR